MFGFKREFGDMRQKLRTGESIKERWLADLKADYVGHRVQLDRAGYPTRTLIVKDVKWPPDPYNLITGVFVFLPAELGECEWMVWPETEILDLGKA